MNLPIDSEMTDFLAPIPERYNPWVLPGHPRNEDITSLTQKNISLVAHEIYVLTIWKEGSFVRLRPAQSSQVLGVSVKIRRLD
jgi:hypothetical protein